MGRARISLAFLLFLIPCTAADWNPKLAADYLDSRQKDWFAWKRAEINGGQCISCHTGVTYLMARPALRQALGEKAPTQYETGLLQSLRSRLNAKTAAELNPRWAKEP